MYSIDAKELHKNYAGEKALNGISFSVNEGSLFGILGADGAGKTTLMRILATLITADKGSARVLGLDTRNDIRGIRPRVGYMPQRFSLYGDLSVKENMIFFADVFGVSRSKRRERMQRLLHFSRLEPFQSRRAANLSGGMKQKLALSCALIHTPRLLLLDEPTTGVDPVSRKEFWEILKELREQGITIVVTTPYMDEANRCDSLMLMHRGESVLAGAPGELLAKYPCDLYKLSSSRGSVYCKQDTLLPPDVLLMYPSGGTLHAAVRPGADRESVRNALREVVPEAALIETLNPSVEDLFFLILSRKEAEGAHA